MQEPKNKSLVTTQFSDLPSCLVIDILSRLPISTLVTCRCVCKNWIRLFQDPYFIKLQLAASPMHIMTHNVRTRDDTIFQFGEVVGDTEEDPVVEKIVSLRTLKVPGTTEQRCYLHSCNGLMCFLNYEDTGEKLYVSTSVCVCNPILGEWVSISITNRIPCAMALVFNAKNNQYKLLRGFQTDEEKVYRFEIYTLGGTGQWRSIIDETVVRSLRGLRETFLHGSLHWIDDPDTPSFIYCLDVDNEKFRRRLSLPSPSRGEGKSSTDSDVQLGVVNGCLCVLYSTWTDHDDDDLEILSGDVEIWCMKEYGVEKSWMMMLTFRVPDCGSRIVPPLGFFSVNEEEILMHDQSRWLLSYNLKRRRLGHYQLGADDVIYESPYNPSFMSLREVAKGEEVMSLR